MGLWTVRGGNRLYGTVRVQGSRNGALPLLAASLMHPGVTVLERVPRVEDVERFLRILEYLGCRLQREGECITIDAVGAKAGALPRELTDGLRASVLFLGAMAARFGEGCVPMPTGCAMGPRPLDLHFDTLSRLGMQLLLDEDSIRILPGTPTGGEVVLPYPSVGATQQAMLVACGAVGESVLRGCAKEPEVEDLGLYLTKCGHTVLGAGTDTVLIRPGRSNATVFHTLPADRIAAGTLLCAVAAGGGTLTLTDIFPPHLQPILDGLAEMGCNIKIRGNSLTLRAPETLWCPGREIVTGPWPAFPTDSLPGLLAVCLGADGVTVARERVVTGRAERMKLLRRFGGDVSLTGDCTVVITGGQELHGAHVEARDVQTAAALLLTALQAEGESRILDHGQTARAYACPDALLRQLGADIQYSA